MSRLRDLAEQATAAHEGDPVKRATIQRAKWALDEMSPDLAVLLADAKDALAGFVAFCETTAAEQGNPIFALYENSTALLARIEELEGKA